MAEGDEDLAEKLSAESSPAVMGAGKRPRRLNNLPLLLAAVVVTLLAGGLGYVISLRANRQFGDGGRENQGGSAGGIAREITGENRGGLIFSPPEPAPPPPPRIPEPRVPEPPRQPVDDGRQDRLRLLQRRLRMAEQAADAELTVSLNQRGTRRREALMGREALMAEIERTEEQLASLREQGADTRAWEARLISLRRAAEAAVSGSVPGDGGTAIPIDYAGRNDLARARQFSATVDGDRWTNPSQVEAPRTLLTLRTGTVLPAVMVTGINSELPGQILAQVSQDVYDTPTGRYLLIPQGSRLVGEYSSQIQYGQSRVFAVWQRIVFPDGKALDIGNVTASDAGGMAGLKDRVNNHYVRIFGSAIMMSTILAGIQMTQNNRQSGNGNQQRMSDALSESLGQVFGGVIAEMVSKNLSIAPTLEIRPGFRLNVMLLRDLTFESVYRGFDYAAARRIR